MAWIESHDDLGRHPKTRKLAGLLDASIPTAVGHLQFFWWWVMTYAPDGDLTDFSAEDIATGSMWDGDAAHFLRAMAECGCGDRDGFIEYREGRCYAHDWEDHGGRVIGNRRSNAERQARFRERSRMKRAVATAEPQQAALISEPDPRNDAVTVTRVPQSAPEPDTQESAPPSSSAQTVTHSNALRNGYVTVTSRLRNADKREALPNPSLSPCPPPQTPPPDPLTHPCTLPEKSPPPTIPPRQAAALAEDQDALECVFEHYRRVIFDPFREKYGDRTKPARMATAAENPQVAREVRRLMQTDLIRGSPPLTPADLCRAIDNAVASSEGWLRINGMRTIKWFFADRARVEEYLAMQPRKLSTQNGDRNGFRDSDGNRAPQAGGSRPRSAIAEYLGSAGGSPGG